MVAYNIKRDQMLNPMDMTGKLIIVTGASDGIGRAAALHLAMLGAKTVLISRDVNKLKLISEALGKNPHKIYPYDLTDLEGIEDLIRTISEENGKIDGMVHCAGVSPMMPLKSTKYDLFHNTMLINFYAFAELVRCAGKAANCNDGASFLAVSSVSSVKGNKAQSAYAASKAAVSGVIKPMAKELSSRGIRVNSVLFGIIKTGMYEKFLEQGGDMSLWNGQYLGLGSPEDAANVISFLLSDASKLITGTDLIADGGYLS